MALSRRALIAAPIAVVASPVRAEDAGGTGIAVPIRFQGTRVTVSVRLGGHGPYDFMIDTGAYAGLIREDLAEALHLARTGQTRFNGRTLPVYDAGDVTFGDIFAQRHFAFAGFGREGLGDDISGTLSAALLTAVDGELDFDRGMWRIFANGRGAAPMGFTALDSEIAKSGNGSGSACMFVHGVLGGKRYRFLLDTGGPGHIRLDPAAAKASGLLTPSTPFAPVRTASTNGPGRVSPLIRADVLDLGGGLRFERPLVVLNQTPGIGFPGTDGLIGLGLLRQMNLATEVRAGRVWGKRNGLPSREDTYPRSGIWFDPAPVGVRVRVIGTGSPAAAAGLREGDVLPGIDLQTAVQTLRGPAGNTVPLTVERDARRFSVSLTLADYL